MQQSISFDRLPIEVAQIGEQVNRIESMVLQLVKPSAQPKPQSFYIDGAVSHFKMRGIPISKSKLQKLTASRTIPFKRFNGRVVFDAGELDVWIKENATTVVDNSPALRLAASANRKMKGA